MLLKIRKRTVSLGLTLSILSTPLVPVIAISDEDFKAVTDTHRMAYRTQPRSESLPKGVAGLDEQQMADLSNGGPEPTYMRFRDILRWKRERALQEDMKSFDSENSVDSSNQLNEASHGEDVGKSLSSQKAHDADAPTFLLVDGQTLLKYKGSLTKFFEHNPSVTLLLNVAKGDGFVAENGTLKGTEKQLPSTLKHLWISNKDANVMCIADEFFQESQIHTLRMSTFENLTTIGDWFFSGCSDLVSIILHPLPNLTTIKDGFFVSCSGLVSITLPSLPKLTTIGDGFIHKCTALANITLPSQSKLTTVGNWFIVGSSGLQEVEFTEKPSPDLSYLFYEKLVKAESFAPAASLCVQYLLPPSAMRDWVRTLHAHIDSNPITITEGDPLTPDEILQEIARFYFPFQDTLSDSDKHLFHKVSTFIANIVNRQEIYEGPLTLKAHNRNIVLHNTVALFQYLEHEKVSIDGNQNLPSRDVFSTEERNRILPFMKAFLQAFKSNDLDQSFTSLNAIFRLEGSAENFLWPLLNDFRFNALSEWEHANPPAASIDPSNVIRLTLGVPPLRRITSLPPTDKFDKHLCEFFETYFTLDKMVAYVHGVLTSDASPLTANQVRGILGTFNTTPETTAGSLSALSSASTSTEAGPVTHEEVKRILRLMLKF